LPSFAELVLANLDATAGAKLFLMGWNLGRARFEAARKERGKALRICQSIDLNAI
jgi:hypothetical protein